MAPIFSIKIYTTNIPLNKFTYKPLASSSWSKLINASVKYIWNYFYTRWKITLTKQSISCCELLREDILTFLIMKHMQNEISIVVEPVTTLFCKFHEFKILNRFGKKEGKKLHQINKLWSKHKWQFDCSLQRVILNSFMHRLQKSLRLNPNQNYGASPLQSL